VAIVTLSFISHGPERVAGIPESVEIRSSGTATIYYTLDGSLPTPASQLYTEAITLPTGVNSVVLSAVGYYFDDISMVPTTVLSNRYGPDWMDIRVSKYLSFDGICYMYPGGANIPLWYDENGDAAVFIDSPLEDLRLIKGDRNADGSPKPEMDDAFLHGADTGDYYDDEEVFYTSISDTSVNIHARNIIIDGTKPIPSTSPYLVNNPYMTLRDPRRNRGADLYNNKGSNYFSGGASAPRVVRELGMVVFYYFDVSVGRWIKSIQNLAPRAEGRRPVYRNSPFVIPWVKGGTRNPY
jgi:hypothetical protein